MKIRVAQFIGWGVPAVICLVVYGLLGGLLWQAHLRADIAEAEAMLMFHGTEGPFLVVRGGPIGDEIGHKLSSVIPGVPFAYVNSASVRPDVEMRGQISVRPVGGQPILHRSYLIHPGTRPIGDVVHIMTLPIDASSGEYELVRENIQLRPALGIPRTIDLPPFRFTVR